MTLFISGCASVGQPVWYSPNRTKLQTEEDYMDCRAEALKYSKLGLGAARSIPFNDGIYHSRSYHEFEPFENTSSMVHQCMELKGYRLISSGELEKLTLINPEPQNERLYEIPIR